ncbi:JAB domain-containing protein [Aeromonas allosaccharophila]|uniref:JAB domain-containing protein n=1 Tax=Aeromonas allosaccharophila TaxID=656 RepID=UPI002ADF9962|nr:JAB domain-containing protein [Aeromonas allosaccharophila]
MRYHKLKAGEYPGTYVVTEPVTEQDLLRIANQIARKRLAKGTAITSTTEAAERLQDREHEVFGALFLDSQHRVLAFEELFRGTLDSASIYPREVVKRALLLNSGAIIAVHNHPSGDPEPSQSDRVFTQALKEALTLVDVRLLDHLVVGAEGVVSMAERGQL